ncbi:MAG: hypothetical protein ACT4NU_09955 [Chromatiales bacterium]
MALVLVCDAHAWTDPNTLPDPAAAAPNEAADAPRYRTLSDIRRLAVYLRGTNSREWSRYGFTDTEVREAITKRLLAAGFDVVGPGSSLRDTDTLVLEVAVHVNDQALNNSFLVFLRLKDKRPLPQSSQGYITHTIWSDWRIGGFEPYRFEKLRAIILELVESFAGSYQLYP